MTLGTATLTIVTDRTIDRTIDMTPSMPAKATK